jgi:hypothetical protein
MTVKKLLFFVIPIYLLGGCREEQQVILPDVFVNIRLNLTSQEALPLRQDGGFIYQEGGVRGIIIYRQDQYTYRAFERNCTFQPQDSCAQVQVDASRLFMIDPCCSSQFGWNGQIMGGPAPAPLKRYQAALDGNILTIYN